MKTNLFIKISLIYFAITLSSFGAQIGYYEKGVKLYKVNKIEESKILFERDIAFNPKSEKSYLYLAKIYKKNEKNEELEVNLNNVLLLNPQNDEAIYMLTLLKIEQSDYEGAKKLIDQFTLVCNSFCSKEKEIKEKLLTLSPENE
jgi:tetratricopeptide (TPR) repeat protein